MTVLLADADPRLALAARPEWGEIAESERPLWVRYFSAHPPSPQNCGAATPTARGVDPTSGRAVPSSWARNARQLSAAGFTPLQFYVLAQVIAEAFEHGQLAPGRHRHLFERWPAANHGPLAFRLCAEEWTPWLAQVRAGSSPHAALATVLA
ncbi:hypothetical protein [Zhihengliuella flava]|uniref:Uncharacterized protein n=1 Tax=Zhihengliuella flava TaxID=1285193 RepID=A0A931GIN6_9MICC|nr:hypothetical protein [Zhihengliuella flava]MBG6084456.1 hypothetical protein [Zhihengliuella flava]